MIFNSKLDYTGIKKGMPVKYRGEEVGEILSFAFVDDKLMVSMDINDDQLCKQLSGGVVKNITLKDCKHMEIYE